jgi:hypothetical protein
MDFFYQLSLIVVDLLLLRAILDRPAAVRVRWFAGALALALVLAMATAVDLFDAMDHTCWLLFVHAPSVAALAAVLLWRQRRTAATCAALASLALGATGIDAFLIEPRALGVTRYEIESSGVGEAFRIALVADIQTSDPGAYEDAALGLLAQQRPDLILFTGDYLQVHPGLLADRIRDFQDLLSRHDGLGAPLGAYAVRGNVDGYRRWTELFAHSRISPLEATQSIEVNRWLTLTGLGVDDSFDPDIVLPRSGEGFHIVFGHSPDYALGEIDADLLVAGHTHGGQVRIPFFGPIITFSKVPRSWAGGRTSLGKDKSLIVSRGVGMERGNAPPIRFFCPPEIVVIDVRPTRAETTRADGSESSG